MCAKLCLLFTLTIFIQSNDAVNPVLRKLNSKINLIKSGFQREIDDLKYNILDLSTELDIERYRNDELERKLNETLRKITVVAGDGLQGSQNAERTENLEAKMNSQEEQIKLKQQEKITQLDLELREEKEKRVALEIIVESIRDKCDVIDNHGDLLNEMKENLTNIAKVNRELEKTIDSSETLLDKTNEIRYSMNQFATSLRSAFNAEKRFVRNLTRGLKSDIKRESKEIKNDINAVLSAMESDISNLRSNVSEIRKSSKDLEELDNRMSSMANMVDELSSDVAQTQIKLDANEKAMNELSSCCFDQSAIVGTTTPTPESTQPLTSTSQRHIPSVSPVTLEPGGPAILPLYEEEMAQAIRIGSRVVRGRDWSWQDQDGTPPGPGSVVGWYGGGRSSREVYVKWDRGIRANYRVGAHGKYDLYLLPDQNRFEIQPIFGPDLEEAIKIGSRVVRGRDWAWGDQDGNPPTPGTVTGWQDNDQASKQVVVKWDSGKIVNYRVGAQGKYDLYLLKDQ